MDKTKDKINTSEYISLKQASKLCSYSQDYLSLRARQGKLKAIKLGRNWVTTQKWLNNYTQQFKLEQLEQIELEQIKTPRKRQIIKESFLPTFVKLEQKLERIISQPIEQGLAFSDSVSSRIALFVQKITSYKKFKQPKLAISAYLIILLLIGSIFCFNQGARASLAQWADESVETLTNTGEKIADFVFEQTQNSIGLIQSAENKIANASVQISNSLPQLIEETAQYIKKAPSQAISAVKAVKKIQIASSFQSLSQKNEQAKSNVKSNLNKLYKNTKQALLSLPKAIALKQSQLSDQINKTPDVISNKANVILSKAKNLTSSGQIKVVQLSHQTKEKTIKLVHQAPPYLSNMLSSMPLKLSNTGEKAFLSSQKAITTKQSQILSKISQTSDVVLIGTNNLQSSIVDSINIFNQKLTQIPNKIKNKLGDGYLKLAEFFIPGYSLEKMIGKVEVMDKVMDIEPLVVQEITQEITPKIISKQVIQEKITQITQITETIESSDLEQLNQDIDSLSNDITSLANQISSRIDYTTPSYAPIYVPSSGIQVAGHALLTTLNVSGSGSIGGSLSVKDNASFGNTKDDNTTFDVYSTATFHNGTSFNSGISASSLSVSGDGTITGALTAATTTITGDFTVQDSDGIAHLYVQNNTGNIGIGTSTPPVSFAIDSTNGLLIPVGTDLQRPDGMTGLIRYNTDSTRFEGYANSSWTGLGGLIDIDQDTYVLAESSPGADEDVLFFYTSSTETMRLTKTGNLGIGTTTPKYKLAINSSNSTDNLFQIATTTNQQIMTINSDGNLYLSGSSTTTGKAIFTYAPQTAGEDNVHDSSLYINATGAASDANLLGIADNGTWKFRIDKEGDIFVQGNITTAGTVTQANTDIIGNLTVEGYSLLGDAPNNDYTEIKGYTIIRATSTNPALTILQSSTGDLLNVFDDDIEVFTILNGGNVGVGTSTPDSKLTVIGRMHASSTSEQLRLTYDQESDKYSSFTIDSDGDLTIDLATENSTTTISDNLSVLGYLNVEGNATTTGSQYISKDLTIDGQCVTGDTLLPVKPDNDTGNDNIEYKQIKDVKAGDYVISLNEKTGELAPAKIKQLKDMGVKTIYKIETEDGRTIRTTGNHPYLAMQTKNLANNYEILENSTLQGIFRVDADIINIAEQKILSSVSVDNFLINKTVDLEGIAPSGFRRQPGTPLLSRPTASSLYHDSLQSANWTKVVYLEEGDEIAVADDNLQGVKFVKIKSIDILSPEQVYDIEVEGTHNFVANGIIAHNTAFNNDIALTGNLNITGYASSTAGLFTLGEIRTASNLTADGNLLINGTGSFASANFTIDASGNLTTTGYASTTTYLNTQGDSHIGGNLSVDGTTTLLGDITQTGNLNITGYASSTAGLFTLGEIRTASNLTSDGNLLVNANATTTGSLNVDGDFLTDGTGSFASANFTIDASGNLTTTGYASTTTYLNTQGDSHIGGALSVDGQCVTGDTLLPVILSQQAKDLNTIDSSAMPQNDNIEYKQIKDVKTGDYVMSLNEKTGELAPAKIKQLMDMGVKTIYKIETEDGRTIRTTGNHPYLAKNNKLDELSANDSNFSLANNSQLATQIASFINNRDKTQNNIDNFIPFHLTNQNNYNPITFGNIETENIAKTSIKCQQNPFIFTSELKDSFIISSSESCFLNSQNIKTLLTQSQNNIFVNTFISKEFEHNHLSRLNFQNFFFAQDTSSILQSGFGIGNSNAGVLLGNIHQGIPASNKMQNISDGNSSASDAGFTKSDFLFNNNACLNSGFDSFIHSINNNKDADSMSSAQWTKVIYLQAGDEIAVADDDLQGVKFVKIKKIDILLPEQVYDIEVEGTHNFVANGIIAHNTAFNDDITQTGNLNITGYASTTEGLFTLGQIRTASNLTADGNAYLNGIITQTGTGQVTFTGNVAATNGLDVTTANLTVGGSNFIVDQSNGDMTTLGYASSTTGLFTQEDIHVGGNASIDGTLDVLGLTTLTGFISNASSTVQGNFTVDGNATTTGSMNIDGDFLTDGTGSFASANLTIDASGNLTTTGYASTTAGLFTLGEIRTASNLTIDGNAYLNGIITQTGTGQVTFTGNVAATNGLDVTTANLTVGGSNFIVDQSNGDMTTLGYASSTTGLLTQGDIHAGGNATIDGTLNVLGLSTLTGFISNASSTVQGNFTVDGNATTTGSQYVGGSLTVAGDIMPETDNEYYLGTTSLRWKDINVGPGTVNIWTRTGDNWEKGYLGFFDDVASDVFTIGTSEGGTGQVRDIQIKTGSNEGIYLDSSGYVGIGYTNPGSTLNINGMVGIGTTAPTSHLDILANGRATGDIKYGIRIVNTDKANTQRTNIAFQGNDSNKWVIGTDFDADNSNAFFIATSTTDTGNPLFAINSDGNIYIGNTVTPSVSTNKLYSVAGDLIWNGTSLTGSITNYWDRTGSDMYLNTITDNIGIGTTTPDSKLVVIGRMHASSTSEQLRLSYDDSTSKYGSFAIDSNGDLTIDLLTTNATTTFSDNVEITGNLSGSSPLNITGGANITGGNVGIGTTTPKYNFVLEGTTNDLFQIATTTNQGIMVVDANGNVGIGTAGPDNVLSVFGSNISTDQTASTYVHGLTGLLSGATPQNVSDNDTATIGATINGNGTIYIDFGAGNAKTITSIRIYIQSSADITGTLVEGSNDNSSWTTLLTWPTESPNSAWSQIRSLTTTGSYRYYRWNYNVGGSGVSINEWEMFGLGRASALEITNSGNIGIGTTNPTQRLYVTDDVIYNSTALIQSTASTNYGRVLDLSLTHDYNDTLSYFLSAYDSTGDQEMIIFSNGNVVNKNNSYGAVSDRRLKENIVDSRDFLDKLNQVRIREFSLISENLNEPDQIGVISQEIESIFPEVVSENGDGYKMVAYSRFIPILMKSFQELYASSSPLFNGISIASNISTTSPFMSVDALGNVGIGTTEPNYKLHTIGDTYTSGTYQGGGADYAEYFYTIDTDLTAGEAVCIDTSNSNAVKRCANGADNNLMGVVSSNPSIVGNSQQGFENNPNYKIIGMLGQLQAKVSTENGNIAIGDSLTSASSTPGYLMKADAGHSTVGIAMQSFPSAGSGSSTGIINVLIARKNKSLTVETVEEQIAQHIVDMALEDEVNALITTAITELNLLTIDENGIVNSGSIMPLEDNTYDIGSPTNRFANIYAQNLITGDLTFTETTSAISGDTIMPGDMLTLYVTQTDGDTHTIPIGLGTALNTTDYGSNNIYFDTTGNVGIGFASTTEPQGKLHLYKSTSSGDERFLTMQNYLANGNLSYNTQIDVTTGDFFLTSNDDSAGSLINNSYSAWNMAIGGASDYFGIKRSPTGSLSYADVFRIQSDGNVGIGTTTPQASFHITDIAGGTTDYLFMISTTTNAGSSEYFAISADGNITQTGNLDITGYASTTTGLFTQANIHAGGNLTVDGNATTTGSFAIGTSTQYAVFTIGNDGGLNIDLNATNATTTFTDNVEITGNLSGSSPLNITGGANITGGNVGIGTTTPLARISVQGGGNDIFRLADSNGTGKVVVLNDGSVGIGVTPEAWHTVYTSLQVGWKGSLAAQATAGAGKDLQLMNNAYFDLTDARYEYIDANSDEASRYEQIDGTHVFYTAAAGTADNAITWATAMTIANDGNVGIGTTNPGAILQTKAAVGPSFILDATKTAANASALTIRTNEGANWMAASFSLVGAAAIGDRNLQIQTSEVGVGNDGNIVLQPSGGNVGIGTAAPGAKLEVYGAGNTAANFFRLGSTAGFYRNIYLGGGDDLYFYSADDSPYLSTTGVWTNAPSFSYLKQDRTILSKDKTLEILKGTNIETYKVISDVEQRGEKADTQIGIILDEAHSLLSDRDSEGNINGYSPMRTASVAFRGVQILNEVLDISNAPTSTSSLIIDQQGRFGIATTTPTNIFTIGQGRGNAIADGWDVYSSEDYKTEITYLEEQDYADILDEIEEMNVATYIWKEDMGMDTTSTNLGIIAEEAPDRVLSEDGKSVSLYDYATFAIAGVKAVKNEMDEMKDLLGIVENEDGTLSMAEEETPSQDTSLSGLTIDSDGYAVIDKIKSKFIKTEELEIKAENAMQSGITIYDTKTGQPYCLYTEYGVPMTKSGECSTVLQGIEPASPADGPVVEDLIVEEPVVEEPVIEESFDEAQDEPVVEEPVVEEPVVEEEVVTVVIEEVIEEPIVEEES